MNDLKLEMRLNRMQLSAQEEFKKQEVKIQNKFDSLLNQDYEVIKGVRRKLTPRRRIALFQIYLKATLKPLDLESDIKAQLKIMDKNQ